MKTYYWLVFLASICFLVVHADDKITQIIYAEGQYNPYAAPDKQQNREIVYYLKDKKLYMHDIEDASDIKSDYEISIYQFKDKKKQKNWEGVDTFFDQEDWYEDDFETIGVNIMHIGQPADIGTEGVKRWAMPVVTKEHWILGNLFRTDLCVLEQRKVKEGTKADYFEVVEPKEGEAPVAEEKTIYLLRKIGVGHRAPTNFVGLWDVQNINELGENKGWAVLSSSTWPTIKWRFLNPNTNGKELRDEYVLDSQPGESGFILKAKKYTEKIGLSRWTKKTKVWIEKLTFYTKENELDKKISKSTEKDFLPVLFYPAIAIDPAFLLDQDPKEALDNITINLAPVLEKIKDLENKGTISKQVKVYLMSKDTSLIIPENGLYSQITVLNERSASFLKEGEEKYIITSSAFDFKKNRMFFGIYDGATKKHFIEVFGKDISDSSNKE